MPNLHVAFHHYRNFFEKIQGVKPTKVVKDVLNVLFELFLGSVARVGPAVLHRAPQGLNVVELAVVVGSKSRKTCPPWW